MARPGNGEESKIPVAICSELSNGSVVVGVEANSFALNRTGLDICRYSVLHFQVWTPAEIHGRVGGALQKIGLRTVASIKHMRSNVCGAYLAVQNDAKLQQKFVSPSLELVASFAHAKELR